MEIVRHLKSPIYQLSLENGKYGTGFDLWRTGKNRIELELMDGCSKNGRVINCLSLDMNIDVSNVTELSDFGFTHHVVQSFEKKIFDLQ